jgi:pyrimidine operon attenuation protein/uracil phosphoribosyltransferase
MLQINSFEQTAAQEYDIDKAPAYDGDNSAPLSFRDVAELAVPVTDIVHAEQPDMVVANDKGARLFAFAVRQAWSQQRGGVFPSGSIDFIRISRDDTSDQLPSTQLDGILQRRTAAGLGAPRKTVFLDDWVYTGETVRRFCSLLETIGIEKETITFITMCGKQVNDPIRHIVVDPTRDPRNSVWNPFPEYTGIEHVDGRPRAYELATARLARQKIIAHITIRLSESETRA